MTGVLNRAFDVPISPADATEAERLFEKAAGVHIEALEELEAEIVRDLDSHVFGIGWWAPALGDKRRIFIADYLVQCVRSIGTNLLEGALHLAEARSANAQESNKMAHSVIMAKVAPDEYRAVGLEIPEPSSLVDLLPRKMTDLHIGGFLRAIGSALDTLAGAAIGVGAFQLRIVRADFDGLLRHFAKPNVATAGSYLQETIKRAISESVLNSGPAGWLEWVTQYRNTVVHRGRRVQFCEIARDEGPVLYSPSGEPMPRAKLVLHLARDPGNSDLQALFGANLQPNRLTNVLEEDAFDHTLPGILRAVTALVEAASRALLQVWRERRAQPSLLPQPQEQWPDVAIQHDRFSGFAPGTAPMTADTAFGSVGNVARLEAAAVGVHQRHRWLTFTT